MIDLSHVFKTIPTEGYTVTELLAKAGMADRNYWREKLRRFLKQEILAGRIIGTQGFRTNLIGSRVSIPVYRPISKRKKT